MTRFLEEIIASENILKRKRSNGKEFEDGGPGAGSMGQSGYSKFEPVRHVRISENLDKRWMVGNVTIKSRAIQAKKIENLYYCQHTRIEAAPVRRTPSASSLVLSEVLDALGIDYSVANGGKVGLEQPIEDLTIPVVRQLFSFSNTLSPPGPVEVRVRKKRAVMIRTQSFMPSVAITKYLSAQEGLTAQNAHPMLARSVKDAIFGMMQSITDAHIFEEQSGPIQLSADGRFNEPVAKAILARIDINTYVAPKFLIQLHKELLESVPVSANEWSIVGLNGGLALAVESQADVVPVHWERAKVVRLKGGHRATKVE